MSDRIEREELVRLVAQRTGQDVGTVNNVVDAFLKDIGIGCIIESLIRYRYCSPGEPQCLILVFWLV
ncbi:MAG: hypothetical protein JW726_11470 [Anaerolineales bacterium]|nr:hypothetical protein [Anaerolineales bacterium]